LIGVIVNGGYHTTSYTAAIVVDTVNISFTCKHLFIDPLTHNVIFYYVCCTGRGDRMKQAKVEAQELINSYRSEKQEEFNNMVLSKGGSEGNASSKLQSDTHREIQEMQMLFQKNAPKAVDLLLSKCCEVSLEVPTARVRATQKLAGIA
jgi:ATP synthase subunit G